MTRVLHVKPGIGPATPVRSLRGVGEGRAALFHAAGIRTVQDLLAVFPFRYEDRRHPVPIGRLGLDPVPKLVRGRVLSAGNKLSPLRRLPLFQAVIDDGTGTLILVWFNQPYLGERIRRGDQLSVWGVPRANPYGRVQMENPDWEILDAAGSGEEGAIVPIYPAVQGIPGKALRRIMDQALEAVDSIDDPLPEGIRQTLGVIPLADALSRLHRPEELDEALSEGRSEAHRRVILEEFFTFQVALRLRRASEEAKGKSRTIEITDEIRERVRAILPFRLTAAQKRVLREISRDLQSPRPMYRLLQGDVGSGKTIVALIAALLAIENGHQAALLAPTEILAEQHTRRIVDLVDGSIRVAKLSGITPARERRELLARLAAGEIDLLVGTHALLEKPVAFHSLGLAIVDEQHRFGVAQRQRLFEKGDLPDVLVMTATPIPRSLAIAIYGGLELSVIDELPPGRTPVRTVVRGTGRLPKVWAFVEEELAAGGQAYVVFPIIEESETLDLKPLVSGFESIREAFPHRRAAMLHGRMSGEEKESTMRAFKEGRIDLLVCTTVIEVGIDVPNASVMVIVDAERFGLSQLHQLRGRVGRGERRSWCILVRDETTAEEAKERLRLFERTRDGFEVAETDLAIRGPGDFLGRRQSGLPAFRFGDPLRHHELMELAREAAIEAVDQRRFGDPRSLARALVGDEGLARD